MKAILLYSLFLTLIYCKHNKNREPNATTIPETAIVDSSRHVVEKYPVGDINNDKVQDTAILSYDFNYIKNQVIDQSERNIKFSKGIPDISIPESKAIFADIAVDLNNDEANEMLVFSRPGDDNWNNLIVYSFKNGKWLQLTTARCFYSDFSDEINRIIRQKNKYYLLGDPPDASNDSLMKRTVMVELPSK